jgi:hypothetical protein
MHYADLSPYTYTRGQPGDSAVNVGLGWLPAEQPDDSAVNVGWLSPDHEFTKGSVPDEFITALRQLVRAPKNQCWGWHECEFCPPSPRRPRASVGPTCGNGEMWVLGGSGRTLVAPVLILHYVEAHQYQPPAEFLRACIGS